MDIDVDDDGDDYDDVSLNVQESDTDDERKVNSLLNNFAKHLAFLKLKTTEENMLPAAAATSILKTCTCVLILINKNLLKLSAIACSCRVLNGKLMLC